MASTPARSRFSRWIDASASVPLLMIEADHLRDSKSEYRLLMIAGIGASCLLTLFVKTAPLPVKTKWWSTLVAGSLFLIVAGLTCGPDSIIYGLTALLTVPAVLVILMAFFCREPKGLVVDPPPDEGFH